MNTVEYPPYEFAAGRRVGHERTVRPSSVRSWDSCQSEGSWVPAGKNSRASHSEVKEGLSGGNTRLQTEGGPSQKARGPQGLGLSVSVRVG